MSDTDTQDTQTGPDVGANAAPDPAPEPSGDLSTGPEALVRRWVDENLVNSVLARDTEMWNFVQGTLPALVRILS